MLTWFFTFFGIGAGIAVLIFLAGVVGVLAWFLWKVISPIPGEAKQAFNKAIEEDRARQARKAAKKQQG